MSDQINESPGGISVLNLRLDPAQWTLAEQNPNENVFVNTAGDVVGVELRTEATAFQVDFDNLPLLRANIREGFGGAGLISADLEEYGSNAKTEAETITKTIKGMAIITKLPQIPHGISYNGLIFLPFKNFSYSLYMRYEEGGVTGLREAALLDKLIKAGEVTLSMHTNPPTMQGLSEDLYDPTMRGPLCAAKQSVKSTTSNFPTIL